MFETIQPIIMSETFSKRGSDVPAASALLNSEHFAA